MKKSEWSKAKRKHNESSLTNHNESKHRNAALVLAFRVFVLFLPSTPTIKQVMDPTNSKVPFLNSAFKLESKLRPRSTFQPCRFLVPTVQSISSFSSLSTSNLNLQTQFAVLPPFTRRFFATQQTPTPVPASSGLNNASTAKVTSSSTSASSSASTQPRGFAAFKARPFLHTLVFGFTHVSICWALGQS